jgi:UDP-N-acetylglucosamine:LPS N-acetylglucosamine transferase
LRQDDLMFDAPHRRGESRLSTPTAGPLGVGVGPDEGQEPHTGGRPLRVLFISAGRGGGHDGVMRAMSGLLAASIPVVVKSIDFYSGQPASLVRLSRVSGVRSRSQWAWAALCQATDSAPVVQGIWGTVRSAMLPPLIRSVQEAFAGGPDLIVAVHHIAGQSLATLVEALPRRPQTAVVITDYVPHQVWLSKADLVVVSEVGAPRVRRRSPTVPLLTVPLLPCEVAAPAPPRDPSRTRILAAAGLDGTSETKLLGVLSALDATDAALTIDVEVICGRNLRLVRLLSTRAWRRLRVRAEGYVHDLPERLAAADLALLRASPQTLTESLAAGTPVIAFDWHAHERANPLVLESLCAGIACETEKAAVSAMRRFVNDAAYRETWIRGAVAAQQKIPGPAFVRRFLDALDLPPQATPWAP